MDFLTCSRISLSSFSYSFFASSSSFNRANLADKSLSSGNSRVPFSSAKNSSICLSFLVLSLSSLLNKVFLSNSALNQTKLAVIALTIFGSKPTLKVFDSNI